MSLPEAFRDEEEYPAAAVRIGMPPAGSVPVRVPGAAVADRLTLMALAGATFSGAFLLFLVQPLVAKFVLPWFGGGPAVWTTCMLFFQAVLLAGYSYAHLGVKRLSPRAQAVVHVTLLVAAALGSFTLTRAHQWQPPAGVGASELAPLRHILLLLGATVLLPCVVLSATSPLLNAWYARAAPASGARVYRLYAVSNAGSLLALVAYPFVIEPALSRRAQAVLWAAGVAVFAVLCGYCAVRAGRAEGTRDGEEGEADADANAQVDAATPGRPSIATRLMWLALPAAASVMLLATTNTMTHDVAAMPLLWVLPLTLYLLTFILAFDAPRWYRRGPVGLALAMAAAGVCLVLLGVDWLTITARVALLAAAMFVCCLACHGELAALKPPPRHLTDFYLTISAGGAIGGAFVAIGCPLLFDRYAELHLALWACCALALIAPYAARRHTSPHAPQHTPDLRPNPFTGMLSVAGLVILAAVLWEARDPYRFAGGTAVGRWRDFYGVVTLYEAHRDDPHRASILFRHAGVTHGLQFLSPAKRHQVTTYFGPTSGIGIALSNHDLRHPATTLHAPTSSSPSARHVGVVGLGAGTLAAYGGSGDTFRFYELSPTVERVARDHFTFLADSPASITVIPGDGRLSLEREPPQQFNVLVLDAFSGHAIPYHLLTAEAFALYRRHLAPRGVIAVNVSNRYVDIQPVISQQAARLGLTPLLISSPKGNESDALLEADWILLTDDPDRLAHFRRSGGVPPRDNPSLRLWTDDYAALTPVLR